MRKSVYLLTALLAVSLAGCRKGATPEPEAAMAEVEFSAKANISVSYTRADQNTFNGAIGAINAVDGWEFSPAEVSFAGLTGDANTPQTITTNPERVVVPVGEYRFVSCAVSGNGTVAPSGDALALTGGVQTADNDVVWASTTAKVVNKNNEPFAVELNYVHVFSAVRFELTCDTATPDELMAEATISGVENLGIATNGSLNVRTGAVTPATDVLGGVEWRQNYLIIPGVSQAGELTVNYRGTEYKGTLPVKTFKAGERMVISIKLNTSSLGFTATVQEWSEIIDDDLILE